MYDDAEIRNAVFTWLVNQTSIHGTVLPRRPLLERGFYYKEVRIPMLGAAGIFKPKALKYPLSITSTPDSEYADQILPNELLSYSYRGTNPTFWDNVALKNAMRDRIPIVYFLGLATNRYLATWPVYIIGADDNALQFHVSLDECKNILRDVHDYQISEDLEIQKKYSQAIVLQRIHQHKFRERVLEAYQTSCAFCNLKHRELLDAAHIIPDSEPDSSQSVSNGLSLCKLHHAAFDSLFIGVTPDYKIIVRDDILLESDGPVLLHGLINLHGAVLKIPSKKILKPNPEYLDWKFKKFLSAG